MARARITIQIEEDLIKKLKLKIIEMDGDPQKGDMSLKIEEAIRLWLEKVDSEKRSSTHVSYIPESHDLVLAEKSDKTPSKSEK